MKTSTLFLVAGLSLAAISCAKKNEPPGLAPPPEITVYQTHVQDVPIYREYVGQIFGFQDIAIRARVEGSLEEIHFDEGKAVEARTLLYTLESEPFDEKVAAQQSYVAEANTSLVKAENDLNRVQPLAQQNAVSQRQLDASIAQRDAAEASVEAAQANLHAAEIHRDYTEISSPVSGIIGKTMAKVGDFVGREPNPIILNTVSRIDRILVQFFISETEYLRFSRHRQAETESDRQEREENIEVKLILADGSIYEHNGQMDFFGREIDPTTGSLLIQASFPNPDSVLRPGQFARIKVNVRVEKNSILIPQRCVTELQGL